MEAVLIIGAYVWGGIAGAYGRSQLARSLMWTSIIMFTGAAGCLAIVRFL